MNKVEKSLNLAAFTNAPGIEYNQTVWARNRTLQLNFFGSFFARVLWVFLFFFFGFFFFYFSLDFTT